MARGNNSSSRIQRNIKEKNRRICMNDQLSRLASLIRPQSTSKLSVLEILNQATIRIKQLQENEERQKRWKEQLKGEEITCNTSIDDRTEEAAEVIEASQLHAGDKLIFIIKSKAASPRIGIEASKIEEKLKELIL